jgi:preprotein translocase subunit SecD
MTSVLNVDTIADKAGTGPVALTKQDAAKAYLSYDQTNTTVDVSFNTSSVGDTATGQFTQNYTNALDDANNPTLHYSSSSRRFYHSSSSRGSTTTGVFRCQNSSGSNVDDQLNSTIAHGDLA